MREIGEAHKSEIEAVLAEFRTLAESIPKEDFESEDKQLETAPYMHVADRMSNTVMGSRDQLLGVVKRMDDPTHFDMYTFVYEYLLQDRFRAEPAEPTFEAEIKAFIDLRYVIVYHPVDYRDAEITENAFVVEPLKMIVAMYDRMTDKWLFTKTYHVDPPEKIEFTFNKGQRESNAAYEVQRFYVDTVKPQIEEYIQSRFGGTIEFDHDAYRRDGTRR